MLKIGILGCGKQGFKHASAMADINNVQVFVADQDSSVARELAQKFKFHYTDSVWECDLDAIIISTPTLYHYEALQQALKRNIHIFCEKPLVSSSEEFIKINELYKKSKSILYVGFVYRFSPVIKQLHQLCQTHREALGKPLHAIFRIGGRGDHQVWKHHDSAGGVVNEMLVHMLDLCQWFLGPYRIENVIKDKCIKPYRVIQGNSVKAEQSDFMVLTAQSHEETDILFQADFVTKKFSQYFEIVFENGSCFGSIEQGVNSFFYLHGSDLINFNLPSDVNLFGEQLSCFLDYICSSNVNRIQTLKSYEQIDSLIKQIKYFGEIIK